MNDFSHNSKVIYINPDSKCDGTSGTVMIKGYEAHEAHIVWDCGEITYLNDNRNVSKVKKA